MNAYRAGWIFLAAANPYMDVFGVSHKLTGSAMFTKLNRNLATLGLSMILWRRHVTLLRHSRPSSPFRTCHPRPRNSSSPPPPPQPQQKR